MEYLWKIELPSFLLQLCVTLCLGSVVRHRRHNQKVACSNLARRRKFGIQKGSAENWIFWKQFRNPEISRISKIYILCLSKIFSLKVLYGHCAKHRKYHYFFKKNSTLQEIRKEVLLENSNHSIISRGGSSQSLFLLHWSCEQLISWII